MWRHRDRSKRRMIANGPAENSKEREGERESVCEWPLTPGWCFRMRGHAHISRQCLFASFLSTVYFRYEGKMNRIKQWRCFCLLFVFFERIERKRFISNCILSFAVIYAYNKGLFHRFQIVVLLPFPLFTFSRWSALCTDIFFLCL